MRLSLLKILVFAISGFLIFKSINFGISKNIANCWSNQFTINKGDTLTIYANPIKPQKKSFLVIYDIHDRAVDSVYIDLSARIPQSYDEWIKGQNFSGKVNYKCNLAPGVYHLEKHFSFCVRNPEADIEIILPHLFQLCSSNSTGASFFSPLTNEKSKLKLINSKSNIPFVINYSKTSFKIADLQYLNNFLEINLPNKKIGFISDMDLTKMNPSKTYIFYGNYSFMEVNTAIAIKDFVFKGGKLIIASSSIMNNKVRINRNLKLISFYGLSGKDPIVDSINSAIRFNDSLSSLKNYQLIGMDYMFADKPQTGFFKYCNSNDSFFVKGSYFNGIPLLNDCLADLKLTKFDKIKIYAKASCTYKLKKGFGTIGILYNGKGKIIQLPTEEWFCAQNLNNSAIKNLTLELFETAVK